MSNISRIPFTELFEKCQAELVRDKASNVESEAKYKGFINEAYCNDLTLLLGPVAEDYLRTEAVITTIAEYSTGHITVAAAGSSVTGVSSAWTSTNSNGALLKATDEEGVYRVAYSASTTLTLSKPTAWVDDAVTLGDYELKFDRYALASDFSHMCIDDQNEPESVFYWRGGAKAHLTPLDNGEYDTKFSFAASGTCGEYTVKWDAGAPYLHPYPIEETAKSLHYNYIPFLTPMMEYTTGYVSSLANAGVALVGASTAWNVTSNIDTSTYDYYFRVDADGTGSRSVWYKVYSVGSATTITLATAYGGTAISSGTAANTYTISRVSRWPNRFDSVLMYLAAMKADPDNNDVSKWKAVLDLAIPSHKAIDGRRIQGQRGRVIR